MTKKHFFVILGIDPRIQVAKESILDLDASAEMGFGVTIKKQGERK